MFKKKRNNIRERESRERFKFYFKVKSVCLQQEEESQTNDPNNKLHICGDELLIVKRLGGGTVNKLYNVNIYNPAWTKTSHCRHEVGATHTRE